MGRRYVNHRRTSWNNINVRTAIAAGTEFYGTIDQSENRVVFTKTNVFAGMMLGAALANDDVAGNGRLSTE